jgi:hypothetical protein
VLSSLLVAALAVVLTIIAQAHSKRIDTTMGSAQSLRPQSLNYIQKDLNTPVRIVGLYPKIKNESNDQDFYQPVADLLNDYAAKGRGITVQMIDPDTQKDDFNKLVAEVTSRFGGEVRGYRAVLNDLPPQSDALRKFATDEAARFRQLPGDQVQDQNLAQELYVAYPTLLAFPRELSRLSDAVDADVNQQIPSYKEAVEEIRASFTGLSQAIDLFSGLMEQVKAGTNVPKPILDYVPGAEQRAAAAKKILTDMLDRIGKLGELKELDDFREQLHTKSIIVITDSGYKILQFDDVWKVPEGSNFASADADVQPRLAFSGEQHISAAILALTKTSKPMVVFVRPSGPPLTASPSGAEAVFSAVAGRLRDYNFDVREKDVSGQSAMLGNEPTDDQMKSAVWVVVRMPQNTSPEEEAPIDSMLAQHLREGGAAMVMLFPTMDPAAEALQSMGLGVDTDKVIVHEALPTAGRRTTDMVDAALQGSQLFFLINQYGQHPIAQPIDGLYFMNAASCPVNILANPPPGVTATPLLPIPQLPHFWAASGGMAVLQSQQRLFFNPKPDFAAGRTTGDIDNTPQNPLYGAAASENSKGGRIVVVGSYWFASSEPVDLPDVDMLEKHGISVARLPGNGEFFVDSIFWLAHMDDMLAISPHALQVARIEDMPPAEQYFWKLGVLTAGLPALVIVAGLMVYVRRRD